MIHPVFAAGTTEDDIEALAKSVAVLKHHPCFVAACAVCGAVVPDGQVMCSICASR